MKASTWRVTLRLAFRNLGRAKRRVAITALVIAFGVGLFIWMDGFVTGMTNQSETNLITYETGAFRILNPRWWKERDFMPLKYSFEGEAGIRSDLDALGWRTTPLTEFYADLILSDGSLILPVTAVDLETIDNVLPLTRHLVEGSLPPSGVPGVVIGAWLAEDLGLEVGSEFLVQTRTRDGSYQTFNLVVTGLFNTPLPSLNRGRLIITRETAEEYLQLEGAVTSVVSAVPNAHDVDRERNRAAGILSSRPGLALMSWQELGADAVAAASADQKQTGIMLFLFFIMAAVGVANTMLMAVYERIREMGVLRALGLDSRGLRRLFLTEAFMIGAIGSLGGLVMGSLLTAYFVQNGLDFTAYIQDADVGYRVSGVVYSTWNWATLVGAFLGGVVLAGAAAWFPVRRAEKMDIVECLRHT